MNIITQEQLIRDFKVMNNGEIDFFLGAGASIQSGIPTGGNLVWYFKRDLYCTENHLSTELYKDLNLASTQRLLQEYFDRQGSYPAKYAAEEYSHYFERCNSTSMARKRFIESLVAGKNPSLGYLCLANLLTISKIKNVWTTNFDSLTETAVNILAPTFPYAVCSSANQDSLAIFLDLLLNAHLSLGVAAVPGAYDGSFFFLLCCFFHMFTRRSCVGNVNLLSLNTFIS